MDRILIIDDDAETVRVWTEYFHHKGYEVFAAQSTAAGLELARSLNPSCILLDVRFDTEGDDAGYYACRRLREFHVGPIIMLSAYKIGALEKIQGLEFGATGYLEKTTTLRELEGWVRAQVRNFGHKIYRVGPARGIEVDTRERVVRKAGQPLPLTQTEYTLFEHLCAHQGAPQSKQDLLELLYADDLEATESRLTSHIYNLRRHVEDDPKAPRVIQTVHGMGYRVS